LITLALFHVMVLKAYVFFLIQVKSATIEWNKQLNICKNVSLWALKIIVFGCLPAPKKKTREKSPISPEPADQVHESNF